MFTGSGTLWRNMVVLEPFEVQNCTDASDIYLWMETFPPLNGAHFLKNDRALSYLSNATSLRSISILQQRLCPFYWRVSRLPRDKKLSKRWRAVDRWNIIGIGRQWSQKTGQACFVTNLGPEVTTYYQYTPGPPEILFFLFLSHCWRRCFVLF